MKKKTKKRATAAIARYLELKGCEILEEGWSHGGDTADFIVLDGFEIAFVFGFASENIGEGIPDRAIDRKTFERLAAAYLAEHPDHVDCAVRADIVSLLVLSDNRAMIRHHVNAIDAGGLDLRP